MMEDKIERRATTTENSPTVTTTESLRDWVRPTIKNYSVPDATASNTQSANDAFGAS